MNIEQIAQEVAEELFLGGKAVGHEPAEFLRRCLSKLVATEDVEPVAYQSTRNGFIAKEDKNPEYNTGLYTEAQLAAAQQRTAEACAKVCDKREKIEKKKSVALREQYDIARAQIYELNSGQAMLMAQELRNGDWREFL